MPPSLLTAIGTNALLSKKPMQRLKFKYRGCQFTETDGEPRYKHPTSSTQNDLLNDLQGHFHPPKWVKDKLPVYIRGKIGQKSSCPSACLPACVPVYLSAVRPQWGRRVSSKRRSDPVPRYSHKISRDHYIRGNGLFQSWMAVIPDNLIINLCFRWDNMRRSMCYS